MRACTWRDFGSGVPVTAVITKLSATSFLLGVMVTVAVGVAAPGMIWEITPCPAGEAKAMPASSSRIRIISRMASNWRVLRLLGLPPPPPPPPVLPVAGG